MVVKGLVCSLFLVRQYGEMIVQFLVKSTKFDTVIVFGELINFRYRSIRNSFKGGPLLIQGGGGGYHFSYMAKFTASFILEAPNLAQ